MRAYEVMVILDPSLDERTIEPSLDKYLNVIRKDGGSIESLDVWGRRRMAYEIDHRPEADYRLYQFNGDNALLERLNQRLRITVQSDEPGLWACSKQRVRMAAET